MTNKQAIDRHRKLMSQSNAIRSDQRHTMKVEIVCALLVLLCAMSIFLILKAHDRQMQRFERLYLKQESKLNETNRVVLAVAKAGSVNNKPRRQPKGLPDVADWR